MAIDVGLVRGDHTSPETRLQSIAVVSVSHVGLRICQATPRSICVSSSGHVRGIGKSERSRTVVRRVSASVVDREV